MNPVQLRKWQELCVAIVPANPFYTAKLRGCDLSTLASVPFTTKKELVADQAAHPPFGTNLTYPVERYSRFAQTSGSTGKPMRWLDTEESWAWMARNWSRVFETAGVTAEDRVFFAFSFGPFLGFWTAFEAASRMGCLCVPSGGMRSAARLHLLIDSGATVLCCTPTYALHLAQIAREEGIYLAASRVRRIIVAGEPGGSIAATRRELERLWSGARVVDHHGMTEIGPVSYGCPAEPGVLHVIEDEFIADVIDPVAEIPLPEGSRGELGLTNLGRAGSPLIRYRTGDVVETRARGRCACGSDDLALIGGILGRTDDMVVVRGVNVYPTAVEDIVRSVGGVTEYRVRVFEDRSLVELAMDIELEDGRGREVAHRLEFALRDALSLRVPVTVQGAGTLPRFEMKARRWIRS